MTIKKITTLQNCIGGLSAIWANTLFDNSKPEFYKAKIINKEIEKGKTTAYRIDFESLGSVSKNDLMRVSKKEFERLHVNDSIELELRKGFLKTSCIINNNLAQK